MYKLRLFYDRAPREGLKALVARVDGGGGAADEPGGFMSSLLFACCNCFLLMRESVTHYVLLRLSRVFVFTFMPLTESSLMLHANMRSEFHLSLALYLSRYAVQIWLFGAAATVGFQFP